MMSNLAIAVCGAMLDSRTNLHFVAIASNMTPADGATSRFLSTAQHRFAAMPGALDDGHAAALKQLFKLAYREAQTLAYADSFRAIMIAFAFATCLVPLLRNVTAPKGPPAPSH